MNFPGGPWLLNLPCITMDRVWCLVREIKILRAVQQTKKWNNNKSKSTNPRKCSSIHIWQRTNFLAYIKNYYNSIRRQARKFFAWAKDLKRHFTKKIEEWPLISTWKHVLNHQRMQIKTSVRFCLISTGMTTVKKKTSSARCWRVCGWA